MFFQEYPENQLLIFVEYQSSMTGIEIASHSMTIDGKVLEMTKVILSDFGLLYEALSTKKAALPVKILRRFKDELYSFALTREPGPTMQVASLDDNRINEETLALNIGLAQTGRFGLARAVNSEQWYRNIILQDLPYSADEMLEYAYPELAKQNSWKLPVWYYLMHGKKKNELAENKAPRSYSEIVTEKAIKHNSVAAAGRKAKQIWNEEKRDLSRALRILGNLPEDRIDIAEFQAIIQEMFQDNPSILDELSSNDRSSLHRIIRIYDYLKYGKNKTP